MSPCSKPLSSASYCDCGADMDIVVELVSTDIRTRFHYRYSPVDSYLVCKLQRRNFLPRNHPEHFHFLLLAHAHGSLVHIITRWVSSRWMNLKNGLWRQFCLRDSLACLRSWFSSQPYDLEVVAPSCQPLHCCRIDCLDEALEQQCGHFWYFGWEIMRHKQKLMKMRRKSD